MVTTNVCYVVLGSAVISSADIKVSDVITVMKVMLYFSLVSKEPVCWA